MTLGIDTDVLVNWAMAGAPHHLAARRFVERQVAAGRQLGITPQVVFEFIHIVSDPRRFEKPLPMDRAVDIAREIWDAPETVRLAPPPAMLHRALELLRSLGLGRKRILDTALAATLENAGVDQLATYNVKDFEGFGFERVFDPLADDIDE
jgi:predicted nucleic acid-binding protein